jgi:general nucleoside transport system permease protein
MTATTGAPGSGVAVPAGSVVTGEGLAARRALRNARIRGVAFLGFAILAFYYASRGFETAAAFSFWISEQGGETATLQTSVGVLWLGAVITTVLAAVLQLLRGALFRWRPWLIIIVIPWVVAIFADLLAGQPANLTGLISGSLELTTPIALGAMAGILSERSGMFNIAIEGNMLVGACVAAIASSVALLTTSSPILAVVVGIVAAMLAGALVGLLLAWLGIRHKVDQIIAGTVINIGSVGITSFIYLRILSHETQFNSPATVPAFPIPFLESIPVIGPMFFNNRPFVYLTYIIVIVLTYMIFKTRWGLRLRAAGEKPAAAGTVGINVLQIRYRALLLAGMIAGLAGSYLSLATSGSFQMEMTAGKGFIGLAAMIFGGWHPIGAFFASFVFGFADTAQSVLSVLGVQVPTELLNAIPYVVTIVVVAGVVGRVRGPAAAGQPYEQG